MELDDQLKTLAAKIVKHGYANEVRAYIAKRLSSVPSTTAEPVKQANQEKPAAPAPIPRAQRASVARREPPPLRTHSQQPFSQQQLEQIVKSLTTDEFKAFVNTPQKKREDFLRKIMRKRALVKTESILAEANDAPLSDKQVREIFQTVVQRGMHSGELRAAAQHDDRQEGSLPQQGQQKTEHLRGVDLNHAQNVLMRKDHYGANERRRFVELTKKRRSFSDVKAFLGSLSADDQRLYLNYADALASSAVVG